MKRACLPYFSLILAGFMIYNSLGYYLANGLIRVAHRQEVLKVLSSIPDEQLVKFCINKDDIKLEDRLESGREFILEGKRYDVKKWVDHGSYIVLYCFNDIKDDQLLTELQVNDGKANLPQSFPKASRLLIDSIIKSALPENTFNLFTPNIYDNPEFCYLLSFRDIVIPVPTLPPQA